MPHYSPKCSPGREVTLTASAAIIGGQLVVMSGVNIVAPSAGSNASFLGVARQDAAAGDRVVVTRGGVQRLIASGAINGGDRVTAAAAGKVVTGAANLVGTALSTVADGARATVVMDH